MVSGVSLAIILVVSESYLVVSDRGWCMTGGVWWCLMVSDACLVVSGCGWRMAGGVWSMSGVV